MDETRHYTFVGLDVEYMKTILSRPSQVQTWVQLVSVPDPRLGSRPQTNPSVDHTGLGLGLENKKKKDHRHSTVASYLDSFLYPGNEANSTVQKANQSGEIQLR